MSLTLHHQKKCVNIIQWQHSPDKEQESLEAEREKKKAFFQQLEQQVAKSRMVCVCIYTCTCMHTHTHIQHTHDPLSSVCVCVCVCVCVPVAPQRERGS